MEQEIILEGIHVLLEEIRDNMKKSPEVETIKLKLGTIEQVCNELAEKKLVTEDIMAGFISYMLKQRIEMNKKQDEKIERVKECILWHHKYVKEHVNELQKNAVVSLGAIYELLNSRQKNESIWKNIQGFNL